MAYISTDDWLRYINRLRRINDKAAEEMKQWIQRYGFSDNNALMDFAYGLATKYGEASAALSAEFYDAIAELSSAFYAPAEVAQTATYGEVAKAVNGTMQGGNADMVANAVSRLVKMAGVDTTMKNALRDGAEWAWIPHGDTCAFCITLASRGWQRASKKAIKGGHAEHIHANCDCTYAIRFDSSTKYGGYEPEKYLEEYNASDGSPTDRINAMRRRYYAENKDTINEQKRAAYASRKERQEKP